MRVANPSQRKKKTGDSTRSSGPNRGAEGKKARVFGCRQIFFMDRIRFDQLKSIYKLLLSRFGPQGWWPGRTRTEIIIGAILTQNTNWQNVEKAILNLKKARLLNFSALDQGSERAVAGLIRPAGYFNVKARRLKNFVKFFIEDMNSSWKALRVMPFDELRQKLLAVNGVGPETADSILLYALDRPTFVVDAYTKRIFSRYGLIDGSADYGQIQRLFMDHLPADVKLFNEYHALIVRLAKEHCRSRPICAGCPLQKRCTTGRLKLLN